MVNSYVPHLRSLVSVSCIEIIVQVKILILSSARSNKHMMAPLSALCERRDYKLVHLNFRRYNGEIVQLQSALNDDYNNFQEKSNAYISRLTIGRFFPNLVLVRSLRSSFIDSFCSTKKRCNTIDSCFFYLGVSLCVFLFLDFVAISGCVFNIKTIILLGLTGYQIIITILELRASLYAKLRVPTRVYDVEGGAIFSKNSTFVFFDGTAWTPLK